MKKEAIKSTNVKMNDEDIFLTELMEQKAYWGIRSAELEKAGKDATQVKEFAEAYKVMIYNFTKPNN